MLPTTVRRNRLTGLPARAGRTPSARATRSSSFIVRARASMPSRSWSVTGTLAWASTPALSSSARPYSPTSIKWCSYGIQRMDLVRALGCMPFWTEAVALCEAWDRVEFIPDDHGMRSARGRPRWPGGVVRAPARRTHELRPPAFSKSVAPARECHDPWTVTQLLARRGTRSVILTGSADPDTPRVPRPYYRRNHPGCEYTCS